MGRKTKYTPKYAKTGAVTRRYPALLAVILVLAMCFGVGGAVAKYLKTSESSGAVRAQEFYFTSEQLEGTHKLKPGTTQVTFTVGNYADALRYSEMDITVTAEVTNGATIKVANPTLEANGESETEITISNLNPGETYTVTVTGTNGYTKTLTGTFQVQQPGTGAYQWVEEFDGYVLLTVWCEDYTGPVTIEYPNGAIPDNTNPNMKDWKTNGSGSVTLHPYESYVFRFFTNDPTGITAGLTEKKPE